MLTLVRALESLSEGKRSYYTKLTVRFGDVDYAGTVYYANFLHYFHFAMEEFFREVLGINYATFIKEQRMGLPTVHLDVEFIRPLVYGDEIAIEVAVESIGRTSIVWRYRVFKLGEPAVVAQARRVTVNVDLDTMQKRDLPERLRRGLERHCSGPDPAGDRRAAGA